MTTQTREGSALAKRLSSAAACFAILAVLQGSAQVASSEEQRPTLVQSGTITLDQTHLVQSANGGGGSGTLTYQGKQYPFDIIGADAVGLFKVTPEGTLYNVTDVGQFGGTYTQADWSYALNDGKLWLEKTGEGHIVIGLTAKRPETKISMNGKLVTIIVK